MIRNSPYAALRDLQPRFSPLLVLRPSRIHGTGVFANSHVPEGEFLMQFGGYLFHNQRRYVTGLVVPSTAIGISEDVILAEPVGSEKDLSDHLNHSCDPNTGFRDAITLITTRPVEVGDEITIDYAYWEADESWQLKVACACGSPVCRSVVRGSDWRLSNIADRFMKYASPFVRRRLININL